MLLYDCVLGVSISTSRTEARENLVELGEGGGWLHPPPRSEMKEFIDLLDVHVQMEVQDPSNNVGRVGKVARKGLPS